MWVASSWGEVSIITRQLPPRLLSFSFSFSRVSLHSDSICYMSFLGRCDHLNVLSLQIEGIDESKKRVPFISSPVN